MTTPLNDDWKQEAELLRTQLVQCTIAMREVSDILTTWSESQFMLRSMTPAQLMILSERLDSARSRPVKTTVPMPSRDVPSLSDFRRGVR